MGVPNSTRTLFVSSAFPWASLSRPHAWRRECVTARPRTPLKRIRERTITLQSSAGGIEEPRLRPVGADGCSTVEVERLASSVAGWLDGEYPEDSLRTPHRVVGDAAAAHYAAVRSEGTDELAAILLALGARLEQDTPLFRELFVGPWEVANKMSDLVLDLHVAQKVAVPPTHSDDAFGRYNFLQLILDGEVERAEINGAVAITAGFRPCAGAWSAAAVDDGHFRKFGDSPPDVFAVAPAAGAAAGTGTGGENEDEMNGWSDTLKYMRSQLGIEDEEKREEFQTFVEALHGVEISRIRRRDREDEHAATWRKWEIIAMWLHLKGDY